MKKEANHIISASRSKNMSAIKSKNTKPEIAVRKLLHSMADRFRLNRKGLAGSPDIVLPKYKTVIFVHVFIKFIIIKRISPILELLFFDHNEIIYRISTS